MPEDINNVVAVADVLNELAHRFLLCVRPGILCLAVLIQSALIADTYTFFVETAAVRTNSFYRTGRFYIPVLADIEMITRSVESSSAMTDVQVIFCETLVFARSGAMDYYQVYSSHEWIK